MLKLCRHKHLSYMIICEAAAVSDGDRPISGSNAPMTYTLYLTGWTLPAYDKDYFLATHRKATQTIQIIEDRDQPTHLHPTLQCNNSHFGSLQFKV